MMKKVYLSIIVIEVDQYNNIVCNIYLEITWFDKKFKSKKENNYSYSL